MSETQFNPGDIVRSKGDGPARIVLGDNGTPTFKDGDVVRLKNGGPAMTVGRVHRCAGMSMDEPPSGVGVCWHAVDGTLQQALFHSQMLDHADLRNADGTRNLSEERRRGLTKLNPDREPKDYMR